MGSDQILRKQRKKGNEVRDDDEEEAVLLSDLDPHRVVLFDDLKPYLEALGGGGGAGFGAEISTAVGRRQLARRLQASGCASARRPSRRRRPPRRRRRRLPPRRHAPLPPRCASTTGAARVECPRRFILRGLCHRHRRSLHCCLMATFSAAPSTMDHRSSRWPLPLLLLLVLRLPLRFLLRCHRTRGIEAWPLPSPRASSARRKMMRSRRRRHHRRSCRRECSSGAAPSAPFGPPTPPSE